MAEAYFNVKSRGVMRVRMEPTEIFGTGSATFPTLMLQLKLQLLPAQLQTVVNYTLLRLAGKLAVGNENTDLASFEAPPLAEGSNTNSWERVLNVVVPLDIRQIKHIEELRDGKDLLLKFTLTGLVALEGNSEFERLQDISLQLQVPRSHWIDRALNVWRISDLRLLEINSPANGSKEVILGMARLAQAEQFYRTGDYPHVLTELRSAFAAVAESYSAQQADKNTFEKMLVNMSIRIRKCARSSATRFTTFAHIST